MPRLFIALPVPTKVQPVLTEASRQYPQYLKSTVPTERWHLTILFLGDIQNPKEYLSRLTKPLVQMYVPTVNITHVGRGLHRLHLWAWATPTLALEQLRQTLIERMRSMRFHFDPQTLRREFAPHIHLADFWPTSRSLGLADYPAQASFTAEEAHVYQGIATPEGVRYSVEGTIPLTP